MQFLRSAIFVVAALMCAQSAYAGFEKLSAYSGPASMYNTFTPMQCNGYSYCFPAKLEKIGKDPVCRSGFTYDDKKNTCYRQVGASCPSDCTTGKDSKGKAICIQCPKGMTLDKDGQCVVACQPGCSQKYIGGKKYCSGVKTYAQVCADPITFAPTPVLEKDEAICMSGDKPIFGKCKAVCPAGCTEDDMGKTCKAPCPNGFKLCKNIFGDFCATNAPLFGCDSCDIMNKMYLHLDKDTECKYPKPASPKPSTPKAPTKPKL